MSVFRRRYDPWNAPGAIHVPSDFAPAPPVPAGTTLGNVQQMAKEMELFHQGQIRMASDPEIMRTEIDALTDTWSPDRPGKRGGMRRWTTEVINRKRKPYFARRA